MPMFLIKSRYRTKSKPKTQKFATQIETTLLHSSLQNFKQKVLSGNGFMIYKRVLCISN